MVKPAASHSISNITSGPGTVVRVPGQIADRPGIKVSDWLVWKNLSYIPVEEIVAGGPTSDGPDDSDIEGAAGLAAEVELGLG